MRKMHKGKSEIMRKRLQNIQKVQIINKNEKKHEPATMGKTHKTRKAKNVCIRN